MKLDRQILDLAVPNIISNITVPLLGMADLALMGHLASQQHIGAIALGTTIFNMIYMIFAFLRMGTSGFTAQAFGAKENTLSILILSRALFVALSVAFFILIMQLPIEKLSFWVLDASKDVEELTRSYYNIRIWAAPATISIYAFNGWFIGMQNAKIPMFIAIIINVINITLNFVFVYFYDLSSDGVALGTVVAQYIGLSLALIFLLKKYPHLLPLWKWKEMMQLKAFKLFMRVNGDIFIRTVLLISSLSFFTIVSAQIGDTILAVNSILFQFFLFYSYFIDGFAYAAEALVGKHLGAGDPRAVKHTVKRLFLWGLMISLPFTAIYFSANDLILRLLTDQSEVLNNASPYLFWVALIPLITFPAFLWDGIFIGATASRPMRNTMIIASIFVYLPAYYLLTPVIGNHGLWLALFLFMAARGISLTFFAPRNVFRFSD
ncbi:MAG: MATE family efflux transporter [Bacteroidales bacterium]|nr:MATE family efflux transporter [Bacteroidales bacterium]MCF8328193.1 MATE family efflux transporter [Bacteroidales bacterium]